MCKLEIFNKSSWDLKYRDLVSYSNKALRNTLLVPFEFALTAYRLSLAIAVLLYISEFPFRFDGDNM